MRTRWLRYMLVAAVTSAAALIGPGIGSAAVGSAAVGGATRAGPGSVLWTSVHAAEGHAVAVDSRGGMVFVAGSTGLVAYNAVTGATLWDNSEGPGRSVAVTPNGRIVFVIKPLRTGVGGSDYSTSAFDTTTGNRLWARRYNGRANGVDIPTALAVSLDGRAVFVTGNSKGKTSGRDYATVAYAAVTGRQLWVSRYSGPARGDDAALAIAVNLHGTVFVTGMSPGRTSGSDFATVAYAAATGAPIWTKRYDNAHEQDGANSVGVSPNGRRVFVTGGSEGRKPGIDFATVAYAAATGAPLWVRRYHGPTERNDVPAVVLVSPRDGGTAIIAGASAGNGNNDFVSVAYSVATGRTKWVSRVHRAFQPEFLGGAAVSPDGRSFYLTGSVFPGGGGGEEPFDALTVAAKVATGAQKWAKVITPSSGNTDATGIAVAVSPDSGAVYNLVQNFTPTSPADFSTIAFRA